MKDFEIINNDYGDNYILHFEDDTYGMVNLEYETVTIDDPAVLLSMGFWADDGMEPVTEDILARIKEILNGEVS